LCLDVVLPESAPLGCFSARSKPGCGPPMNTSRKLLALQETAKSIGNLICREPLIGHHWNFSSSKHQQRPVRICFASDVPEATKPLSAVSSIKLKQTSYAPTRNL